MNLLATFAKGLKRTLAKAITDKDVSLGSTKTAQIFDMPNMKDAFDTYQIWGGLGLADEQAEGANITVGAMSEGPAFTFYARKYGKKAVFSEQAIEDMKYPEIIRGGRSCIRAVVKGAEHEGALIFDNSFDTNFPYGDNVPLCSASHPTAKGTVFSNLFAVGMAPSVQAYSQARLMARQFPSHDGLTDGLMVKGVIAPAEQETAWEVVLGSKLNPDDPNNHSQINVVNGKGLKLIINEYITANPLAHWFQTDAEDGLMMKIRRKLRTKTWVGNDQETVCHAATIRWAFGHANPRCIIGNPGL